MAATRFESPIGELVITASDAGVSGVYFPTSRHVPPLHGVERGQGVRVPRALSSLVPVSS